MFRCLLVLALVSTALAASEHYLSQPVPPLHFPITSVTSTAYAIPSALGVLIGDTTGAANWTLPLTYYNGGNISVGQMLWVRNIGSNVINTYSTSPETIDGNTSVGTNAGESTQLVAKENGTWSVVSHVVCLASRLRDMTGC